MSAALRRSFASLEIPNYRRYFAGQIVSLSGNWMQMVAEMWLILELTGSGVAVGVTSALQFLPMLLFGAWGGVLADRLPKRSLLIVTQAAMALPALALWALTATGAIVPWMVFALVFVRGAVNSIDNPTRQSFVIEMVGADRVVNAVGLNSVLIHSARIVGPAGAGRPDRDARRRPLLPAQRARPSSAMIVALRGMDPARLDAAERARASATGCARRCATCAASPALLIPLAMMVVVGTLAFNFQVLLPLLGRFTFDGGAAAYTALAVAMAVGSVAGALATGARGRVTERLIVGSAVGFGLFALLGGGRPHPAAGDRRAGPARRRERHLRRRRQLDPPARRQPGDARPGDGALLGRLPRLDADRRADRRLARRGRRPALGPGARRRRGARRGGRRLRSPSPPPRPGTPGRPSASRLSGLGGRRWRRLRRPAARSRYRPGVRTSFTGSKAEEGST